MGGGVSTSFRFVDDATVCRISGRGERWVAVLVT